MAIRYQASVTQSAIPLSHFLSFSSSPAIPTVYADGATDGDAPSTLVATAVSILGSHRSRSRWNFLKSHLPSAGISSADASAIIVHLRNNPRTALRFFLWSRDLAVCRHDLTSYSTIVHILARSRLRPAALSLLRVAVRLHPDAAATAASSLFQTLARTYRSCDSAPFVFDLLIQAYLHSHRLDQALAVVSALRSRGVHPLPSTAASLLRAAARLRGSAAALDLYRDIVDRIRPNSQTFNAILLALYRDGRTESNGEILAEMARFGCDPNAFTYSILMAGLPVAGARKLWEEMAAKGMKPDATAYNTLIKGYCEVGEAEKGEEVYREMVLGGVAATGTTFELLIKGHCRAAGGDVGAAVMVYGEMRRSGFVAGAEVVDEMVEAMCGKGMVEEGMKVLRDEAGREGISMGRRRSYVALIKVLCEAGRMEEAAKLQAEMAGKGLEADGGVYGAFVCGFERAGNFEMAERVRKEMDRLQIGGEGS